MTSEEILARAQLLVVKANEKLLTSDYTLPMLSVGTELVVEEGHAPQVCWRAHLGEFTTYPTCCPSLEDALDRLDAVITGSARSREKKSEDS